MGDVLVIKCNYNLNIRDLDYVRNTFVNQKAQGVVLLPLGFEAVVVPDDIEVKIEGNIDENNVNGNGPEIEDYARNAFVNQKAQGVVLLPLGFEAVVVPDDIEVKIERNVDENNVDGNGPEIEDFDIHKGWKPYLYNGKKGESR